MTIRDTPPAPGYTRTPTGVTNVLYRGWWITKTEVRAIERRNRYRHTDTPEPPADDGRRELACETCGRTFATAVPQARMRCPQCRRRAGRSA